MALDETYLSASDGTGDASLMHVTNVRSIGSTVIDVDTVVGVPAKFIATSGTPNAQGFIDPTTVTNFFGHVSGSTLVIDGFCPGSSDSGNTTSQIVVVKPNTAWANLVASEIGIFNQSLMTGWISVPNVAAFVAASTTDRAGNQFKFTGVDLTGIFEKGDKLRLTNNTVKYFYIVNVALVSGDTVVTTGLNTDYVLANAAITSISMSKMTNPSGFPKSGFAATTIVYDPAGNNVTNSVGMSRFTMAGNMVKYYFVGSANSGSTQTAFFIALPVNFLVSSGVIDTAFRSAGRNNISGASQEGGVTYVQATDSPVTPQTVNAQRGNGSSWPSGGNTVAFEIEYPC